jgi:hypothetical protein
MRNKFLPLSLLAAVLLAAPLVARAAEFACGEYTCVAAIEWDGPHDWTVAPHSSSGGADINILDSYTWTNPFALGSTGYGVLEVNPGTRGVGINLTNWDVPPGTYRIITRMGSFRANTLTNQSFAVEVIDAARTRTALWNWRVPAFFEEYISETFTVSTAGPITISFIGDARKTFYMDYVWVVKVASGPGTPTATLLPATATPAPTSTPYCYAPPPTPAVPPFGATATPTPNPNSDWFVYTDFNGSSLPAGWSQSGTGSITVAYGAAYIPASTAGDRIGLTHERTFNTPFYITGRASAQLVPAGKTMRLEVWLFDGSWSKATEFIISSGRAYPFYYQVNSAGVTAVSFSGRMSDESTDYGISLEYLWLFGRRERGPICGASGQPVDPIKAPPLEGPPPEGHPITGWPADKPCPGAVLTEPNNFWGPLLTGLTLFMDQLTAPWPAHEPSSMTSAMQTFVSAPIWAYPSLIGLLFDLRPLLLGVLAVLAMELVRAFWSLWMLVKKTVPFLGGG